MTDDRDARLRRLVRRLSGDKRLLERQVADLAVENAMLLVFVDALRKVIGETGDVTKGQPES